MPYNVIDIRYHPEPKTTNYIFDTNVLLPALGFPLNPTDRQKEQLYLDYFNGVYVHLQQHPDFKIYIPSVQLSELFNRLLQSEAKKYYKAEHGNFSSFYKQVFRAMTECKNAFDVYKDGLLIYSDVVQFHEYDKNVSLAEILDYDVRRLDINDMIILRLAQTTNATLVSDDADYEGQDITQATLNTKLVKNARNQVGRR